MSLLLLLNLLGLVFILVMAVFAVLEVIFSPKHNVFITGMAVSVLCFTACLLLAGGLLLTGHSP